MNSDIVYHNKCFELISSLNQKTSFAWSIGTQDGVPFLSKFDPFSKQSKLIENVCSWEQIFNYMQQQL